MIELVLIILIAFWLLGYITIPWLPVKDIQLFVVNSRSVTLWDVLIFFAAVWLIGLLPSPFRQIVSVILVLYLLSILGVVAITGLSNILVISLIVGTVIFLLQKK